MWEYAQAKLSDNAQGTQRAATVRSPSLLAGRVFDEAGEPLVATHACKRKVRYRYHVSRALQHEPETKAKGWRIPAMELEKAVLDHLVSELAEPLTLLNRMGAHLSTDVLNGLSVAAGAVASRLDCRERLLVRQMIAQVRIGAGEIAVQLSISELAKALGVEVDVRRSEPLTLTVPATLNRRGGARRFVQANGRAAGKAEPQEHLVKLLHRARSWWQEMTEHGLTSGALAQKHGVTSPYASRVVRLAFLAPDIVEAIISGSQPADLDARTLLAMHQMLLGWSEQKLQLRIG